MPRETAREIFAFLGDELKQTVSIVVDLASVFDPDGVDVYFLNRDPIFHVRSSEQLVPIFSIPPSGKSIDVLCLIKLDVVVGAC